MRSFKDFLTEAAMFDCSLWLRTHGEYPDEGAVSSWQFSIDPNAPIDDPKYYYVSQYNTFKNAKIAAEKYFPFADRIYILP
jgi:hypothetical protein